VQDISAIVFKVINEHTDTQK